MSNNISMKRTLVLIALTALVAIGLLDYKSGFEVSLFPIYLIPLIIIAWNAKFSTTLITSILTGLIVFISDYLTKYYTHTFNRFWDGSVKLCVFILIGIVFYKIKHLLLEQEKLNFQLTVALSEVTDLHKSQLLRAAELATVNKELETFNYTVAHDLRQPLNNISLYCQTINMLCTGQLLEECSGYVQMIHKTTLRMNNIIGALLDFSRLGHLEPHCEIVDLSQLAREVVAMLQQATPDREVEIRIAEGVTAFADAMLLRMVLDNLLGNAWKYTGRQDNAVIEFGITELEGTPVYFVRDNGPGFEKTDADKLFTPFQRLPNTEEFKGFGIGLATVERIISRHDGRVWAEGKPGEGATFYFTLPDTPIQ